jgi:hypothetical protein
MLLDRIGQAIHNGAHNLSDDASCILLDYY